MRYHNYVKHRALRCEDAIIPQSSRRPLSYLKTNPNFASSTSLEVANEGWNLQCSYSLRLAQINWAQTTNSTDSADAKAAISKSSASYSVFGARPKRKRSYVLRFSLCIQKLFRRKFFSHTISSLKT